jgi:arginyl-tRNA synthetase
LNPESELHSKEKQLLKVILRYPEIIQESAKDCSPAVLANYTYDLVKEYNQFYQQVPIFGAHSEGDKGFRIGLSSMVGSIISSSMRLLGITVPERM